MPTRVALIVNPTSGRGRGRVLGDRARTALLTAGHQVVDVSGSSAEQARDRAEAALADGVTTVVAVGGDGMVHLGVNLTAGRNVRLGIVAAGTGNDFARHLGLPIGDPEAAVRIISAGHTRTVDAGLATDAHGHREWFAGVLGAGFDAVVVDRAQRMSWPKGQMRYNLAVLRELSTFRPIPYVIEVDDRRIETEAMLVAVANATSFGGGMHVAPDADVADGLFDVLVLHAVSIPSFLRVFPSVYKGQHLGHPSVEIVRGRRVRLEAAGTPAQADGELLSGLPLDVHNVSGALEVFVPDPEGTR